MVEGFHAEVSEDIFFVALESISGLTGRDDECVPGSIARRTMNQVMLFTWRNVTAGHLGPDSCPGPG